MHISKNLSIETLAKINQCPKNVTDINKVMLNGSPQDKEYLKLNALAQVKSSSLCSFVNRFLCAVL